MARRYGYTRRPCRQQANFLRCPPARHANSRNARNTSRRCLSWAVESIWAYCDYSHALINSFNNWISLDYDEELGRIALGSSYGRVTILDSLVLFLFMFFSWLADDHLDSSRFLEKHHTAPEPLC